MPRRNNRSGGHGTFTAALDQIATDLTSGHINEPEAVERCREAGYTSHGAQARVSDWLGGDRVIRGRKRAPRDGGQS